MGKPVRPTSGRPRLSSCQIMAEAASELFLERTYAGTTIEDITQRAGVSRSTFFNYFSAKSDLLWVEVDASAIHLADALAAVPSDEPVMAAIRRGLLAVAIEFGPGRVPWALTQYDLMGTSAELEASALSRFLQQVKVVREFSAARLGLDRDDLMPQAIATAVIGAAVAAAGVWARAGVTRGVLTPYVAEAISPVCAGFQTVLDAAAAKR
jgi:AcrR family transcriptional regulator